MLIPSNISWGVFIFVFSFHMYLGLLVLWPFKVHEMVGFLRWERLRSRTKERAYAMMEDLVFSFSLILLGSSGRSLL
jgi:hypothetical protein